MRQLFGTDGIRAKAYEYPLDEFTVYRLGFALSKRFPGTILIGRDTRESGPMIAGALVKGLTEGGASPVLIGVIPTPGVAYLCRTTDDALAGISISASHNPYQDNGIKIFGHDGMKLADAIEAEIEEDLERVALSGNTMTMFHRDDESPELIEAYERFLISGIPPGALSGKKVVLDTGYGAAYRIAPETFRRAGAEVVVIHDTPNGTNINESSGALHPQRLAETVVQQNADYGVAFDGDADRAIFADDAGRIRDGDEIIYLWAKHLKLPLVVTTVMSNFGFEKQLKADGIELVRAQVGDKYVLEQMLQRDALLGGEQSGHIIDRTVHTTGDGIHTALVFGHILGEIGAPFSRLRTFDPMPQLLLNQQVRSKPPLESLPRYQESYAKAMQDLAGRGRILVRYSGTENLVRVMVEGEDEAQIRRIAEQLRDVLKEEIG
ncbi:MAG TPA: phosphoglucosamine mutase [Thermoanaerobaculia bacterium]|nr:phosphoglucosamine mutase [Thermoanaerobaculia bacterium]